MSKLSLLTLLLTVSLSFGLAAAQNNETTKYGIIEASNDLGLSTFSSALESTGLAGTLDNEGVLVLGDGSFAVFAPSDEAFTNMISVDTNGIMENQTELKRVLSYHVVWNDGLFENISQVSSLETLQGENLTLENNGMIVNGARVLQTKKYDNGTIYVIDSVLMPKGKTTMGVVFIPFHFIEAAANLLTIDALDERAGVGERAADVRQPLPDGVTPATSTGPSRRSGTSGRASRTTS